MVKCLVSIPRVLIAGLLCASGCTASIPSIQDGGLLPPQGVAAGPGVGPAAGAGAAATAAEAPAQAARKATQPAGVTGAATASSQAAEARTEPSSSAVGGRGGRITAFRAESVVLYFSEAGADGERVAVSGLSLPMAVSFQSERTRRLEVQMAQGSRWIDPQQVTFSPPAAPQASRN